MVTVIASTAFFNLLSTVSPRTIETKVSNGTNTKYIFISLTWFCIVIYPSKLPKADNKDILLSSFISMTNKNAIPNGAVLFIIIVLLMKKHKKNNVPAFIINFLLLCSSLICFSFVFLILLYGIISAPYCIL